MMMHAQEPSLQLGSVFQGNYEILSELGVGTFGRVYKARQLSTAQEVAVKILRLSSSETAEARNSLERFRRETRLCAQLAHPNIVRLIDSGECPDGLLYVVLEFVPGATLKEVLAAEGKLSVPEAIHLMSQVLDALSCAHTRGIVHRDLKPENIMVIHTGVRRNALVLDFGLGGFTREFQDARLPRITATQEMLGTPCYAAPEQLRGESPSTRSDLYSWGLIFLECLTGEMAVSGHSAQEVLLKQLGPDPVSIPPWLRRHQLGRVLATVTAKQVEQRDVTIEGLMQALQASGGGELPSASPADQREELAAGERRQVTVVCCRFTATSLDGKPIDFEELDQVLHAQHARLAEHLARHGGQMVGAIADRVLLAFGYPQAREDDARRAARAALQIAAEVEQVSAHLQTERRMRLEARIGVHTGLVIAPELRQARLHGLDRLVGLTPHIAECLADRAAAGEVLVSRDTQRLLRNDIDAEAAGECRVQELSGMLSFFRLTGAPSAAARPTAPELVETPLVGRAQALSQLLDGWNQARDGRSGVVVLTGEPGIGKSRLLRELRRAVPDEAWLECNCAEESQNTPLRPLVDALASIDQSLESLLSRYHLDLNENVPLFSALLSLPLGERYAPLFLSAERQKELTLQALLNLLLSMCTEQPRVFAVENLHWADPTTIELASQLVNELRAARVRDWEPGPRLYLVFTTRPEFTTPWSTEDISLVQLKRLGRSEVEEMVASIAARDALPPALAGEVVRRTDGVPLFVEEVTRMLLEPGGLAAGTGERGHSEMTVDVPSSLRDLLRARLDGLSANARETAQLAAVLGREFRYELLQAVSPKDEATLRDDMAELSATGLLYHSRTGRSDAYVFRHALIRDAAYESMMSATRRHLHDRVANTMRARFRELEQNRPDLLAHHFEHAGQLDASVSYYQRAASRVLHHAAYQEAATLLEKGLSLLRTLEPSAERRRLEIDVLSTLGNALISMRGYAAPEVEDLFARASELCEQVGGDIPTHVLYGIWGVHITRSNREGVAAILPRLHEIIERSRDPVALMAAHSGLGAAAYWTANFAASEYHFARGRELFHTEEFRQFSDSFGYGVGIYGYAYGMLTLWLLGFPDRADAIRQELFAIADRARDPYVLAVALGLGMTLAHDRDEPETELEIADRLMALAVEQRLPFWQAAAAVGRGGAFLRRGYAREAVPLIQTGLDGFRMMGVLCSHNYFLSYLAAAHLAAGSVDEGLTTVEEGLTLCQTLVCRVHEAELLRLKGELLLVRNDRAAAEACWRRALDVCRESGGKSYELRVATALARLLRDHGRGADARATLQEVFDWFTEGLDTPDLRAAAALLAEL